MPDVSGMPIRLPVFLAALLLPLSALASDSGLRSAQLSYGVYALGGRAFDIELEARGNAEGMQVVSGVRSTGTANLLLRFRMESDLRLRLDPAGRLSPLRYASLSDGSFSRRSVVMVWGEDGLPSTVIDPPAENDDREPVLPEQIRNTFDPTTALLARVLARDSAAPCTGSDRIFDGRRRFNLHYEMVGMESLPASERSAYAGPALKCQLRFEPIAGYTRKHMENTRKLENEVTEMWLARLPGQPVWLPVRLRTTWMLGEVGGHVTAARINDRMVLNPLQEAPPPAPPEIAP